ncbi:hypothetical protein VCHA35O135_30262 [Vibrio chagasii]|nr:hypothetical protein VCHA35O135_30262 [Vibrio chagasii]
MQTCCVGNSIPRWANEKIVRRLIKCQLNYKEVECTTLISVLSST